MGENSRNTRSGQNSGIGKRSARTRGTGSTSTHTTNPLVSPASSSSRPGPAHKKPAPTALSRRGSSSTPRKPAPRWSSAASTQRQSQPHPLDDEEIVAEIIVKTDNHPEELVDMDGEPSSDISLTSIEPVMSDLDVPGPLELTKPRASTPAENMSTPQPPPIEPRPIQTQGVSTHVPEPETKSDVLGTSAPVQDVPIEPNLLEMTLEESLLPVPQPVGSGSSAITQYSPEYLSPETSSEELLPAKPRLNGLGSTVEDRLFSEPVDSRHLMDTTTLYEPSVFEKAIEDGFPHPVKTEEIMGGVASREQPSLDPASVTSQTGDLQQPISLEGSVQTHTLSLAPAFDTHETLGTAETDQSSSIEEHGPPETTGQERVYQPLLPKDDPMELDIGDDDSRLSKTGAPTPTNLPFDDTPEIQVPSKPHSFNSPHSTQPQESVLPDPEPTEPERGFLDQEYTRPVFIEQIFQGGEKSDTETAGNVPICFSGELAADVDMSVEAALTGPPRAVDRAIADEASESELSETGSTELVSTGATHHDQTPAKSAISHLIGDSRNSFASSASALTERSGLSSKPPSVSSKATTPLNIGSPRETLAHFFPVSTIQSRSAPRIQFNVRPKVSVPTDLTPQEYAMECIEAAENSRLNPYALNREEYLMLRTHISHAQVTTYLNIRNGILRLWVRNPQIAVTREEAIGCAKDTRWFDVANVCFDWLVRRGFINYGCVEIRQQKNSINNSQPRKRRTVVVIGAGFSGLGCARQLDGLFLQYSKRFRDMGEETPRVVVLEGRNRVGGRVYSRAFQTLPDTAPGIFRGKRFTAEMGGMIITGFDRGNPLNILVRGQLGLPYHCLRSDMSLYDTNGTAVDPVRDQLVEHLFNACLDRVSEYKFKTPPTKLIEGNHDLMDEGRDSSAEGHKTIALTEETTATHTHPSPVSEQNATPGVNLVPVSTDRMTGKVHVKPGTPGSMRAAFKAKSLGWVIKSGVSETKDIDLDAAANDPRATLGSVVDEALMQHKGILDLNAQDFRLLNWHIANLEYSNATNLSRLSIKGWDIDAGNEWEGKHTMVVGGYQSVARGLLMLPAPLNIRRKAPVKRITYAPEGSMGPVEITLEDGQTIDADYVVNTIPLGVLKHGNIEFQPPLPPWKTEAIERLGFGVLNKVILVYKEAFWDKDRDIFGMLQTPTNRLSLNQKDYAPRRGRFFQWFNVTNTTGMPCLLALMAGDAGYDTEITPNDELIAEATEILRMRYGARVTQPLEAIVTRWESDRFARGSYSNAGVNMKAEDYNIMARPLGNLFFAGEHTTVTHPATVHGAYLSGLRAASEVIDSILGPIEIPTPLVLPRETSASLKRKSQEQKDPAQARLEAYEMEITEYIHTKIGYYPIKPAKIAGNPYLLFNKANYEEGRRRCEEGRRAGKGKPSPNEVRTMTSKMWKEAPAEVRKPFEDQAEEQKRVYGQALKDWTEAAARWEREAISLRENYIKEHPSIPTPEELASGAGTSGSGSWTGARRVKKVGSYAEDDSDVDME